MEEIVQCLSFYGRKRIWLLDAVVYVHELSSSNVT